MNYDQAVACIAAAAATPITRPAYEGEAGDFAYLKDYVLDLVTVRYGVAESLFSTPTVASTMILRDFVHRALYDHPSLPAYTDLVQAGASDAITDVGGLFRVTAWSTCGYMAWQLHNVFLSLDYESSLVWVINGEEGRNTPFAFNDSHATVEVSTLDDGWVVQDATMNMAFVESATGDVLSMREAMLLNHQNRAGLTLDDTGIRTYVGKYQVAGWLPNQENFFRDNYMNPIYAWKEGGGPAMQKLESVSDWEAKHTAVFDGAFSTAASAAAQIASLRAGGASLLGIVDALRPSHAAVSGFRLLSENGLTVLGDFVTVQLQSGAYATINAATGHILNGSYDQIMDDLLGTGRGLNPGASLSYFVAPAVFIAFDGKVIVDWSLDRDASTIAPLLAERMTRDTYNEYLDGRTVSVTYDRSGAIWADASRYYAADGQLAAQFTNYDSGAVLDEVIDLAGAENWSRKSLYYDEEGQLAKASYALDDGGRFASDLDPHDAFIWREWNTLYSAADQALTYYVAYDAGGSLQSRYDVAGVEVWAERTDRLNAAGQTEATHFRFDHGGTLQIDYDLVGAQVWSSTSSKRNGAGQLEVQVFNYDAGGRLDSFYDLANANLWQELHRRTNATNKIEAEVYRLDDGRTANYFYDHAGDQPWQFYVDTYSPAGALISHKVVMDDGSII